MINLTAKVDNADAKRKFKELETSARNSIKGIETQSKGLDKIGSKLGSLFSMANISVAALVAGTVRLGKKAVQAYNQQQDAVTMLNAALRATGNLVGYTSEELQKFASELQKTTSIGDEVTIKAMSQLITFRHIQGDVFKEGIKIAQDMAAIYGMDLNSAIMQLGKALEDPATGLTMLRRVGVAFTTTQIAEIKKLVAEGKLYEGQLIMLAEMQNQFGGAAVAAAQTAKKAWEGMTAAFGDWLEKVGEGTEKTKGLAVELKEIFEYLSLMREMDMSGWQRLMISLSIPWAGNEAQDELHRRIFAQWRENEEINGIVEKYISNMKDLTAVEKELDRLRAKSEARKDEPFLSFADKVEEAQLEKLVILYNQMMDRAKSAADRAAEEAQKRAEEQKKIQEEYDKWLLETSRKTTEELVNLELERQRKVVEAMDEGYSKQVATAKLNEAQKVAEVQKYVRDSINAMSDLAKNKGMALDYGTFAKGIDGLWSFEIAQNALQLTPDVERVVNEMLKDLNQLVIDNVVGVGDFTADTSRMVDDLLEQIDRDLINGLSGGGFDPLKEQASIIFADISGLSSDMIRQIISNAEKHIASGDLTDEAVAEYRRAIDQANEYLVDKNPWDAIRVAQERYIKATKEYNDAVKSGDIKKQNAALLEQAKAISTAKEAYESINTTFRETLGSVLDLAVALGMDEGVARSFNSLISAGSKVASTLIKVMDTLGGASRAASSAAKSIGSGASTGSLIGAFIGLMIALAQVMVSIENTRKAANEAAIDKYVERINNRVEALKRNLEAISSLSGVGDGWFTEDLFNRVIRANDAFLEAYDNLNKLLDPRSSEKLMLAGEGVADVINNIRMALSSVHGGNIDFGDITNPDRGTYRDWDKISDAIEGSYENLGIYLAELRNMAAAQEEMGHTAAAANLNAVADELEAYLEAYKALQDSVKSAVGDISGSLLNTVRSVWEEFGIAGEDSIARVTAAAKESIGEILDQMISQQIWATTMASYFDTLGEGLVEAIKSGDPGDLMAVFDNFWVGMQTGLADYNKAMLAFYETAEAHGWDIAPKAGGTETEMDAAEGSIRAMQEELSKLQEQWNNLSATDREGGVGKQLYDDIIALQKEIEAAENLYAQMKEQTELEALQALLASAEAKYSLFQKWVQLYGQETAEAMMGEMLDDAQGYVDKLRSGIEDLTAKVKEGTATDEEIAQLEAWESQLDDIMNEGAQAAITAANEASQAWNDALNTALGGAETEYDKLAVLQNEYLAALGNYEGMDAGPMKDAAKEYLIYLEGLLDDQSALIEKDLRDRYKTQEQANAETLKTFEDDIKYAREVLQDEDLAAEIKRQMDEFISSLAASGLEATEEWKLIFGDLENISEEAFFNAMAEIRKSIEESTDLTEEAKAEILKNLDAIAEGFQKTLGDAILEDLKKGFDELLSYMNDTLSLLDAFGASDSLKKVFSGVIKLIEGYRALKIAQEEAALAGTAISLTSVFSSMTTMILGLVSALKALGQSMIQIIDNSSLTALATTYDKLTDAINRSVGAERKRSQEAARQNLIAQRDQLARDLQKEQSKWGFSFNWFGQKVQILGPDQGVVDALTDQLNQIEGALADLGDTMKDDFLQTDAMSFSSELANILTSQYDSYADMMADVEKLTQKTLNNITRQWLTAHFLEDSISKALDALYGGGGEPTAQAYEAFQRKVNEASENFMKEMDRMNLMFGSGETTSGTSNAGVISRSITENTATWIKGLMMNQNLELNDMNKTMQYISKYSERTANGVEDLTRINSQIAQHTSVLPKMAQSMVSLAMDVGQIKNKVGLSRENIQ